MKFEDLNLVWYKNTGAKRFGFWILFFNRNPSRTSRAIKKEITDFLKTNIGPVGERWHYQKIDETKFILKLDQEKDLLFFVLKAK